LAASATAYPLLWQSRMTSARWFRAVGALLVASAIGCEGGALPTPTGEGGSSGTTGTGQGGSVVTDAGRGGGGGDGRNCPCSRRAGENNSWMCPPGTGKVATAEIGPAGGTLILDGTPATQGVGVPFKLVIPYNALTQTVTLQVTELTVPPPSGFVDYSPIYDLQPRGLTFATPALLTIPWENVQGVVPAGIAAYLSTDDGATFTRIADSYTNAGFEMASLSGLGQVFTGYPRTTADDIACGLGAGD